jgi:hypothetical protein
MSLMSMSRGLGLGWLSKLPIAISTAVLIGSWGRRFLVAICSLPPLLGYTISPLLVSAAAVASPTSVGVAAALDGSSLGFGETGR